MSSPWGLRGIGSDIGQANVGSKHEQASASIGGLLPAPDTIATAGGIAKRPPACARPGAPPAVAAGIAPEEVSPKDPWPARCAMQRS